jgi:hypothetical protein
MAARMFEPEQIGMQRLPMKVLNNLSGSLADDRMPDRRHVHADLMGPPGGKPAFDQTGRRP